MRCTLLPICFLVAFSAIAQEVDREQLEANLRFRIPELQDAEITIGEIESSPYGNLKQGSFTINGQQTIRFLLSEERSHLLLITANPVDIGLTEEEIAVKLEEQKRQKEAEAAENHRALSRFAEGRPGKGPADAPITIYEFSDFQCPYCARARLIVEEILNKYPEEIRFVYLHYPLDMHDWAKSAAVVTECASRQDESAFWILHDNFFERQGEITSESMLDEVRTWLGDTSVDLDVWQSCASDESTASNQEVSLEVDISTQTAKRFGLSGTPAFFVNGHLLRGAQPVEVFDDLIGRIKAEL